MINSEIEILGSFPVPWKSQEDETIIEKDITIRDEIDTSQSSVPVEQETNVDQTIGPRQSQRQL